MAKSRVTISLDPELAADVQRLVDEGRSDSVSSWVSEAIRQRHDRDTRIARLSELVRDYEAEFGEIGEAEMAEQTAKDARPRQAVADARAQQRSRVTGTVSSALDRQRAMAAEALKERSPAPGPGRDKERSDVH